MDSSSSKGNDREERRKREEFLECVEKQTEIGSARVNMDKLIEEEKQNENKDYATLTTLKK